jgi:hypothetical protein
MYYKVVRCQLLKFELCMQLKSTLSDSLKTCVYPQYEMNLKLNCKMSEAMISCISLLK